MSGGSTPVVTRFYRESSEPVERGYMFRKAVQAVKDGVPIEELASNYTTLRRSGARLIGLCPIHLEKTPSFTVYPESGSFFCFGTCYLGGDALDLFRAVEGGTLAEAIHALAQRFSITLPQRPERWRQQQRRKADAHSVIEETRKAARRERIFRTLVLSDPAFEIEDPTERRKAVQKAWRIFVRGMREVGQ